jgi:DNA-binding NtrC family response regulator
MDIQLVKNRYAIIGNSPLLNLAIETALRVAPTDMSVLINGESGVGKEVFSKLIHQNSHRKHGPFIAVNCGAIPEGTIDSELFGHEKGAFTGATDSRKGYFETVNGGTIFLDEVGELPLGTQARLLRVLESGEFIRVGSSKIQKTEVRVVAATNRNLLDQSDKGKFRTDLYYRLATVPILLPNLSQRKEDIFLIFMKFVQEFSEKYKIASIELDPEAKRLLENYPWPGNIRQLRNVTEQICVLEPSGYLNASQIQKYLPPVAIHLPMVQNLNSSNSSNSSESISERDILYRILFDLKKDMAELKKIVFQLIENQGAKGTFLRENEKVIQQIFADEIVSRNSNLSIFSENNSNLNPSKDLIQDEEELEPIHTIKIEETRTLEDQEKEMIKKSLERNKGRRNKAAKELGISERTLYRKIKQYDLE